MSTYALVCMHRANLEMRSPGAVRYIADVEDMA